MFACCPHETHTEHLLQTRRDASTAANRSSDIHSFRPESKQTASCDHCMELASSLFVPSQSDPPQSRSHVIDCHRAPLCLQVYYVQPPSSCGANISRLWSTRTTYNNRDEYPLQLEPPLQTTHTRIPFCAFPVFSLPFPYIFTTNNKAPASLSHAFPLIFFPIYSLQAPPPAEGAQSKLRHRRRRSPAKTSPSQFKFVGLNLIRETCSLRQSPRWRRHRGRSCPSIGGSDHCKTHCGMFCQRPEAA